MTQTQRLQHFLQATALPSKQPPNPIAVQQHRGELAQRHHTAAPKGGIHAVQRTPN